MKLPSITLIFITGVGAMLPTASVNAQLVFANDQFDQPQYLVDVEYDRSFQLLSPWLYGGTGAWGMAADNALGVIYYNNAQDLFRVSAATLRPEYLGAIQVDGELAAMDGLAWDSDARVLYGVTQYPRSGIYQIDLSTLDATFMMPIDPINNVGGLDYDNGTHSLLALFDGTGSNGGGLYRVDLVEQAATFITTYPEQNVTDLDGLAAGDGRAYFVADRQEPIYVYDLKSEEFLPPLTSPTHGVGIVSGAAWAPSFMNRLLVSEPRPGRVGRNNRFHIVGAEPAATVHLVFGLQLGMTRVPGCVGNVIEIAAPRIAGSTTTDANGTGQIGIYVPTQAFGLRVILQAVDPSHCAVSNLTLFEFGPE